LLPTTRASPTKCRCPPFRGPRLRICRRRRHGTFPRIIQKRITEDFGVIIGDRWSQVHQPGGFTIAGFSNFETTAQYQLLKDGTHELALLLGLIVDWGGTGASNSGIGTRYSVLTPTFYFGKGFGDLREEAGWFRAFAVTGQVGYQFPTQSFDVMQSTFIPQVLTWSGSIQYSMPYLKSEIQDLQLPDFINHLIPIDLSSNKSWCSSSCGGGEQYAGAG
jgi:hypothetical protein